MSHRSLGVVIAFVFGAQAAVAVDLTGRWRLEYDGGSEFADVVQSGSAVTMTFAPGGSPLTMSGSASATDLSLALPSCTPPSCYGNLSARILPDGNWFDGILVIGAPPLPGSGRMLAQRCECFDGNTQNGDGCSAACRIEPCFTCAGMPSSCAPTADGGGCEDGSPCTTGETCTAGQCGGGSPVAPCIDLSGLFAAHYDSSFVSLDTTDRIEQFGDVILIRDAGSGGAGPLGRIDFTNGALTLDAPVTYILCPGVNHSTGFAALDGSEFTIGGPLTIPRLMGCLEDAYSAHGVRVGSCGDGTRAGAEQCDDGNRTPGDGCGPDCTVEPCWRCTGSGTSNCSIEYVEACTGATTPRRASLRLSRPGDVQRDLLAAQTGHTAPVPVAALGDPLTGTGYQVCLYDDSLPTPRLLFGARVPAGGTCGGQPCWARVLGGFAYRDHDATADGIAMLRIIADRHGQGQATVAARGAGLTATATGLPPLPLPAPLELQVRNAEDGGACFAVAIPAAGVVRNDPARGRFVGRGAP